MTVNGIVTVDVAASAVAGTAQVSVVPAWVTPVGRAPMVGVVEDVRGVERDDVPAGIATLPVLRAVRV